jgi:hypothetical protein
VSRRARAATRRPAPRAFGTSEGESWLPRRWADGASRPTTEPDAQARLEAGLARRGRCRLMARTRTHDTGPRRSEHDRSTGCATGQGLLSRPIGPIVSGLEGRP